MPKTKNKIRAVKKHTSYFIRTTMMQISLRIRADWSKSSLSSWRHITSLTKQNAPKKDYNQTTRTRMLVSIFAVRTCPSVRLLYVICEWGVWACAHRAVLSEHSLFVIYYSIHWYCEWTTKALISLRECAGWSGPMLSSNCVRALFVRRAWYVLWFYVIWSCSLFLDNADIVMLKQKINRSWILQM